MECFRRRGYGSQRPGSRIRILSGRLRVAVFRRTQMEMPLSLRMAKSVEERYRPGMMLWHYEHGLVLYASLRAADIHGDKSIYPWVYAMYDRLIGNDGSIATYREGEYNLDQINAGKTLFALADKSGEKRFEAAADKLHHQLLNHPRCKCGVFWHKEIYPWQIWLDGLYMEGPFTAEYAVRHSDNTALMDIIEQLKVTYSLLRDPETGLLYHAYDESRGMRWSDERTGCSPHFWSRSIGWYLMAVVDVLDFLPEACQSRAELVAIAKELSAAVLRFQDESGMWWQVTDEGTRNGNYLETSGSAMFAYAFYKGVRKGYLEASFLPYAKKALDGIKDRYLKEDEDGFLHLGGICSVAGLGGNPYRDGSFRYYISEKIRVDDFKGVGPFILACTEDELS